MNTKSVFSDDIAAVYTKAKEIIKQHKLLQICRVETTPQKISVIINNLWRIDRRLDERFKVSLHMFSLNSGKWVRNSQKNILWADSFSEYYREYEGVNTTIFPWPVLSLLYFGEEPLSKCNVTTTNAIKCALIAAGFQTLPQFNIYLHDADLYGMPTQKRPPCYMADRILGQYIYHIISETSTGIGMRCLRKFLWEHIVDKELGSALTVMNPRSCLSGGRLSFERYLSCLPYAESILNISRENRNLLPLLPSIPKKYWGEQSLFSKAFWVENSQQVVKRRIPQFTTVAALRWLRKAPSSVVAAWINHSPYLHAGVVIENLSRANITCKVPAIVLASIVKITSRSCTKNICPQMQRLYRLYAIYCFKEWKKRGWKNFRYFMTDNYELLDTCDWLDAEGFRQGYPDKNATWESIQRRTMAWHLIHNQVNEEEEEIIPDWNSLLEEMEIDGVKIIPLTSQEQLKAEGQDMHHCVREYAKDCHANQCRIFSLVAPTGERSTLSIEPSGKAWSVQQHRGVCNENVSEFIKNIGMKVAMLYSKDS